MKRSLVVIIAVCALASAASAKVSVVNTPPAQGVNDFYVFNRAPLVANPLGKLPIGSITPRGWLRGQLNLMANGMTGHLDEDGLSPFISDTSGWMNGKGDGFEEIPYWIKGLGDLGYVLNDSTIQAKARKWLDAGIRSQDQDGYFGPYKNKREHDLWPNMPMLFAYQSLYEATGDKRVIPFMTKYFRYEANLPEGELLARSWQKVRGGDNLESVYWLYNRTGEPWLLDLAKRIHEHTSDWTAGIVSYHGVDFTQSFREPAEFYQQSADPKHLNASDRDYTEMMGEYGQFPGGMLAADETTRVGKTGAEQGAETCAMVEYMYSDELLLSITGDPKYADRCEDVAFNSLPASMTPDLRGLHYLTAANQVMCDKGGDHCYTNSGMLVAYSAYGWYRCCQHNVAQGWPYYAEHLWMATRNNGLAAVLYSSSEVRAKVGDGTMVSISEDTSYPFDEAVGFTIHTPKGVQFPLMLRIPSWCRKARVSVNGSRVDVQAKPLSYIVIDRQWKDGDKIRLVLPMDIDVKTWKKQNDGVSVNRGPLTYSLKIGEKWVKSGTGKWPYQDEVLPTTAWNYSLVLDSRNPSDSFKIEKRQPVTDQPFTLESAPIVLSARARRIPAWSLVRNCPGPLPASPAEVSEPVENVSLVPMGAARLRITVFPVAK